MVLVGKGGHLVHQLQVPHRIVFVFFHLPHKLLDTVAVELTAGYLLKHFGEVSGSNATVVQRVFRLQ